MTKLLEKKKTTLTDNQLINCLEDKNNMETVAINNQNDNMAVVSNALTSFLERNNLKAKSRNVISKAIALNSKENAIKHLERKIKQLREMKDWKNTNLITLKDNVYTTSLYLGKCPLKLNGEQFVAEYDNVNDAIQCIEDFVSLVKSEEGVFVQSINDALKTIATYSKKDRSTRGHS